MHVTRCAKNACIVLDGGHNPASPTVHGSSEQCQTFNVG